MAPTTALLSVILFTQAFALHKVDEPKTCMHGLANGDLLLFLRTASFGPGDVVALPDPDYGRFAPVEIRRVQTNRPHSMQGRAAAAAAARFPVRKGHVIVTKDDESCYGSPDSAEWGPVPRNMIIGKALAVVWPPRHWSLVRAEPTAAVVVRAESRSKRPIEL